MTSNEKRLDLIVLNTLLFGEFFCEIADPQTALTSRSILSEAKYNDALDGEYKSGIKDRFVVKEGKNSLQVSIDYSAFVERAGVKPKTKAKKKDADKSDKVFFKNIISIYIIFKIKFSKKF